jgi:hypothetical protein
MNINGLEYSGLFTNVNWISAAILKEPKKIDGKLKKGAIILSMLDEIVKAFPRIKDYFYLIEWRGWEGINYAKNADIKLVEDGSKYEETLRKFPQSIVLDVALGDFVDIDKFKPVSAQKKYSGIQIASWSNFKRHYLFFEAAKLLPNKNFLKFGHFQNSEDISSLEMKAKMIEKYGGGNINFPYGQLRGNKKLPSTSEEINKIICSANMGILTSSIEGMNRFKMECLSANLPFLVPEDSNFPIKKHINEKTGRIYEPTPKGLANAICYVENHLRDFNSREYILKNTGRLNSAKKLENALNQLVKIEGYNPYFFELYFDGRNQSFLWGENAINKIGDYVEKNG